MRTLCSTLDQAGKPAAMPAFPDGWINPGDTGWVFQACCIRAGEERFNELEYHVPAVTEAAGANLRRDESRVWAFRGPASAIAEAAETLLGQSVKTIIPRS